MRSGSRFWVSLLLTALALAYVGCASEDPISNRGTRTTGSTGAMTSGAGGAATGGPSTTGTGSTNTTSTTSNTTTTTASGPSTGNGGGSVTTASGSGGVGTTGGAGGAGTGGARDAGGTGGSRDGGTIMDAKADVPLPLCNYPEWVKGTNYRAGDIVMYMGKPYIALGDNPGLDPTISTFYWAQYTGCRPPPPPPPTMCAVLDKLLPNGENTFKEMFTPTFQGWVPLAAYSYASLCTALDTPRLTGFVRSGNTVQDKREVAAFFANVALETAYLTYTDEGGQPSTNQDYHGRGALQITGQVIYQEAGSFLGLDLIRMPQLASQAPAVWSTGIWYWMQHANPSVGNPNICHNAIAQGNFGTTIRIIKGDCGSAAERTTQYRKNCMLLNVDPGNTACP